MPPLACFALCVGALALSIGYKLFQQGMTLRGLEDPKILMQRYCPTLDSGASRDEMRYMPPAMRDEAMQEAFYLFTDQQLTAEEMAEGYINAPYPQHFPGYTADPLVRESYDQTIAKYKTWLVENPSADIIAIKVRAHNDYAVLVDAFRSAADETQVDGVTDDKLAAYLRTYQA